MSSSKVHLTRRQVLTGAAALPLFSILTHRANAAEFELKYATGQDPTHPVNLRAKQALDRIRERPLAQQPRHSLLAGDIHV